MDIVEIFGYLGALVVGLVLGLIGGGGSILAVPIFVYLFTLSPITATAYSLFVVGSTSLVGTFRNIKKQNIVFKPALIFAIPAVLSVFITRKFIIPSIPEHLFRVANFEVTKGILIMLLFSIVMILASLSMIYGKQAKAKSHKGNVSYLSLSLQGLFIGLITGMVGAGGGFLIVPMLVIFAKLPMKKAVATSLLIVTINSLIGFLGDATSYSLDWAFLLSFTGLAIVGIVIGVWLNGKLKAEHLKKGFGWFVLTMGVYIIFKEVTT